MSAGSHQGPSKLTLKEVRVEDLAFSPTTYYDRSTCGVTFSVRE